MRSLQMRSLLKVCVKIYYIRVCVCVKVKKKVYLRFLLTKKTNEKPMVNN